MIEFSNKEFYKGRLQCIPDFNNFIDKEPGIKYLKVDGVWNEGINVKEAEEVVALIIKIVNEGQKSIGVVCFNYKQVWFIQELLERKTEECSMTIPPTLFIKNIENVQGDERDIIIFSIGYAPDVKGRFIMNFGSLNATVGENRLNVAITRARDKVFIVSSIYPQQLKVDSTLNAGPKLLRAYLNYSLQVSQGNFRYYYSDEKPKSNVTLISKIQDHPRAPKKCKTQFTFADITVDLKNNSVGLILTDDEGYYASPTPKEPHAYHIEDLKRKHWKFLRVYSRNLWKDRDKFFSNLIDFSKIR